jgi:hypothetical protein
VITFQRKRANRRIVNEEGLLALLAQYGQLRVVEFNSSTSFAGEEAVLQAGPWLSLQVHAAAVRGAVVLYLLKGSTQQSCCADADTPSFERLSIQVSEKPDV